MKKYPFYIGFVHPYLKQLSLGGVKDELKDIAWN
jgi:hypothetical protein